MRENTLIEIFKTDVRGFSTYDCERSLPSGIDGLKTSQRKVIFGMRKKYPTSEVKVSVAAAGIQEVANYHHGSIEGVMVNMAQSFPGANNLPYLEDIGQFGSRISPQASATRYIFTKLTPNFKKLFKTEDEPILNFLVEEGDSIEPNFYLPIIPTILINGANGMGTGFACSILSYNPKDLVAACLNVLNSRSIKKLVPWYSGFTGNVSKEDKQTQFFGVYEIVNTSTMKITELPIGTHTTKYRETLNLLEDNGVIKSYDDNSTEDKTEFIVNCPRDTLKQDRDWILKTFKLISRDTENLTVWTENGKLRCFDTTEDLVTWFVGFRVKKYEARRQYNIKSLGEDLIRLEERVRFIKFYLQNSEWFSKTKKVDIESKLREMNFQNIVELMSIRLYNLTLDQIEDLEAEVQVTKDLIEEMINTTAKDIYIKELKELKL